MIGPEQTVAEQMRDRRRNGAIWLAVALILAITLGVAYKSDQRAKSQDRELASQTTQVETLTGQVKVNGQLAQAAKDAAEEGNRRLKAAGKPTVPVPTVTPVGPASPAPESSSLTIEDVRAVVALELAQHKVQITQAEISQIARTAAALIPKPADGKTPTEAQIRPAVVATVAAYCVGDKCVGPAGKDGDKGDKGDPAPKVTDEELLASAKLALAAYCGLESQPCKGPQGEPGATVTGPPGADGPEGAQGRSVVDLDCMDDGRWRITYDRALPNGEITSFSRGPCRILTPDPTSAPTS